jgi:hypothetical protein
VDVPVRTWKAEMADARLPLSADLEQRSLEDVYRTEFAA